MTIPQCIVYFCLILCLLVPFFQGRHTVLAKPDPPLTYEETSLDLVKTSSLLCNCIVQTVDGSLTRINLETGDRLWTVESDKSLLSSSNYSSDSFMVPSVAGLLYLYWHESSSFQLLPLDIKEFVDYSPFTSDDETLYVASKKSSIVEIDFETGTPTSEEKSSAIETFIRTDFVVEGFRSDGTGKKFSIEYSEILPMASQFEVVYYPGLSDGISIYSVTGRGIIVYSKSKIDFHPFPSQPIAVFVKRDGKLTKVLLPIVVFGDQSRFVRSIKGDAEIFVTKVDEMSDSFNDLYAIEVPKNLERSNKEMDLIAGFFGQFDDDDNDDNAEKENTIPKTPEEKIEQKVQDRKDRKRKEENERNQSIISDQKPTKSTAVTQITPERSFFGMQSVKPFEQFQCLNKDILYLQLNDASDNEEIYGENIRYKRYLRNRKHLMMNDDNYSSDEDYLDDVDRLIFRQTPIFAIQLRYVLLLLIVVGGLGYFMFWKKAPLPNALITENKNGTSPEEQSKNNNNQDDSTSPNGKKKKNSQEEEEEEELNNSRLTIPKLIPEESRLILDDLEVFEDEIIGRGSNGTIVYKGRFGGRTVAVKRMLREYMDIAQREIGLFIEADQHPNIVRYYCQKETRQFVYLALEFMDTNLDEYISRAKRKEWKISYRQKQKMLSGLGSAIRHLHKHDIVHRDIKPQNILITKEGVAKLTDMGLSAKLNRERSSFHTEQQRGSFGWMAPELLCTEERKTKAVDIFAFGLMIFFVVTNGKHPFGNSLGEREQNILKGIPYRRWGPSQNQQNQQKEQKEEVEEEKDGKKKGKQKNRIVLPKNMDSSNRDVQKYLAMINTQPELKRLVVQMVQRDYRHRPHIAIVLSHPFFWTIEKKLRFIGDVSDQLNLYYRDNNRKEHEIIHLLQKRKQVIFHPFKHQWSRKVDAVILKEVGNFRKYNYGKVWDLIRFIRNVHNHYREYNEDVRKILQPYPYGVYIYFFSKKFKALFNEIYKNVKVFDWKNKHGNLFWRYFSDEDVL